MRSIILLLCLLFTCSYSADAQFGKLKDKILKKGKDKKNEKVEEKVKEKKKDADFDLADMMGGNSDIELEEAYSFNFAVDYEIITDDLKEPMDMTQLFSTSEFYFGMIVTPEKNEMEVEKVTMVMDFSRNYMIMLDEDEGRAMVMEFQNIEDQIDKQIEEDANNPEKDFTLTKTSETKEIAGYPCVKYIYTSEDGNGEIWTTTKLDYRTFDSFSYFEQMSRKKNVKQNEIWKSGFEGFMLEMKGVDEEGKNFQMTATNVDPKANYAYTMEEFQVLDMTKLTKGLGNYSND